LPKTVVAGQSEIDESLVEASNRATIHLLMLPVATMHLNNGGLVTIAVRVDARPTQRLGQ
jgi:hypothetical protein